MAEQAFTPDSKSKITPEELAARCKLAKEAYGRNRRIKISWRIAAHALQSWPARDPLELRRLAASRARFKLQTGAVPSPTPKAKAKPATRELRGTAPAPVLDKRRPPTPAEIGEAIIAGPAAAADAIVRESLAGALGMSASKDDPHAGTAWRRTPGSRPPAATIELASPIKTVQICGVITVLVLTSGQRIPFLPAPADPGGEG